MYFWSCILNKKVSYHEKKKKKNYIMRRKKNKKNYTIINGIMILMLYLLILIQLKNLKLKSWIFVKDILILFIFVPSLAKNKIELWGFSNIYHLPYFSINCVSLKPYFYDNKIYQHDNDQVLITNLNFRISLF